ncbi:hypothetical protein [Nocardioides sp. 503]|uniref:hypothetical protein n=1 Tax=Nocardioides sp. 503 TaxID=2508326 RepID=UPI00106FF1FB|nr:hypothetical protein [Nocardioides sp. 503]
MTTTAPRPTIQPPVEHLRGQAGTAAEPAPDSRTGDQHDDDGAPRQPRISKRLLVILALFVVIGAALRPGGLPGIVAHVVGPVATPGPGPGPAPGR